MNLNLSNLDYDTPVSKSCGGLCFDQTSKSNFSSIKQYFSSNLELLCIQTDKYTPKHTDRHAGVLFSDNEMLLLNNKRAFL